MRHYVTVEKGKLTIYNSTKFEDSFHDYLLSSCCPGSISAAIGEENQTDTGTQFCSSTENTNIQTELATCDIEGASKPSSVN